MALSLSLSSLPTCTKCDKGLLLPLEDAQQGGATYLKAWVCSNPDCKWNVIQRSGFLNTVDVTELHAADR